MPPFPALLGLAALKSRRHAEADDRQQIDRNNDPVKMTHDGLVAQRLDFISSEGKKSDG
jgi:hypothetical protein